MTPPRKLHIKSYGCQMNVYDAQRMADVLAGFPEIAGIEVASFAWDGENLRACAPRVWVRAHERGALHLSLQPYPRETEQTITLRDGRQALVRPVRMIASSSRPPAALTRSITR